MGLELGRPIAMCACISEDLISKDLVVKTETFGTADHQVNWTGPVVSQEW